MGGSQVRSWGPRVAALGDSLTLGVGDQAVAGVGAGWAAHVAHAVGASSYLNVAANGTRARNLGVAQLPTVLMELPDLVLLTVGGNDVLRGDFSAAEVRDNLADALHRLERPGRRIVMVGLDAIAIFALLGTHVNSVMVRRVALANEAIREAVEGTSVHLIDGASVLARAGTAAWHIDRIHPSPLGHRVIAAEALDHLADEYPQVRDLAPCGPRPTLATKAWWLTRRGLPWIAKRSRDLIPQVATVVTHELLEERRARSRHAVGA